MCGYVEGAGNKNKKTKAEHRSKTSDEVKTTQKKKNPHWSRVVVHGCVTTQKSFR